MIELEKKIGKKTETLFIPETWDEVYYDFYVKLKKSGYQDIEMDLERSYTVISTLSSDPVKCMDWLKQIDTPTLQAISDSMDLKDWRDIPPSKTKLLEVMDGNKKRRFRILQNLSTDVMWGNQITFERLKQDFKDTEDDVLALGVILQEVDSRGKGMPFDLVTFDWIVNNIPKKVKMIDLFHHVTFFLTGAKKRSLKTSPIFTVRKVR